MRHTRIIVAHYGEPDVFRVAEEACPEPKDGEVRVRVLAAGVALPDVMAREGIHPETPRIGGDSKVVWRRSLCGFAQEDRGITSRADLEPAGLAGWHWKPASTPVCG